MESTSWMARKIMTWYQLRRSVYYSGRFRLYVGLLNKRAGKKMEGMGGGNE